MNLENEISAVRADLASVKRQVEANTQKIQPPEAFAPLDARLINIEQEVQRMTAQRNALRGQDGVIVNGNVVGLDQNTLSKLASIGTPGSVGIVSGCLNGVFETRQVLFVG